MKGYRTVVFNVVSGMVGVGLFTILMGVDYEMLGVSSQTAVIILVVLKVVDNAANVWLRTVTNTAIGQKAEPAMETENL